MLTSLACGIRFAANPRERDPSSLKRLRTPRHFRLYWPAVRLVNSVKNEGPAVLKL